MRLFAISIILIAWGLGFQELKASPSAPAIAQSESDVGYEAMLDYLAPILRSTGKVARIYYVGSCKKEDDDYVVSFPRIHVQPPFRNDTGFVAVQEIFRNVGSVKVSEGADGIIRIVIGQMPATILNTKIPVLTFNQAQQYTESLALWRIVDSKEIDDAERGMRIHPDGLPLRISLGTNPVEGAPHLPESMIDLTLDQALDSVAKTFGNIVFYGVCTEPRLYTIHYVSLKR